MSDHGNVILRLDGNILHGWHLDGADEPVWVCSMLVDRKVLDSDVAMQMVIDFHERVEREYHLRVTAN